MTTLAERRTFAEKYIKSKEGRPFTIEGRDWVEEEFWRPATGWRLWSADPAQLCPLCRADVGSIVDWSPEQSTALAEHRSVTKCPGLELVPILVTMLDLPRRSGKTFNFAALALSTIFLEYRKSILFCASAGRQTATLFDENFRQVVEQSPELKKRCTISGWSIEVPRKKSVLEIVEASAGSIAGRGRSLVVLDECRAVKATVGMSAIPSVTDQSGWECPNGHTKSHADSPGVCPICAAPLHPWHGRIILMSSAGRLSGNAEDDWFHELCRSREQKPVPAAHLYSTTSEINPIVDLGAKARLQEVFSDVGALEQLVEVEFKNRHLRKGKDFLPETVFRATCRGAPENVSGSVLRALAFLDTSLVSDLTSLVIVGEEIGPKGEAWHKLLTLAIQVWNPKKTGPIDPDRILEYCDSVMDGFPNLQWFGVDVRGQERDNVPVVLKPWALDFVKLVRASRTWGKKVEGLFYSQGLDRQAGWAEYERRIRTGLIEHQRPQKGNWTEHLVSEIMGLEAIEDHNGNINVRDRNRKVKHADIADAYANVCLRAFKLRHQQRVGLIETRERASEVLDRLWRPVGGAHGMGVDSF